MFPLIAGAAIEALGGAEAVGAASSASKLLKVAKVANVVGPLAKAATPKHPALSTIQFNQAPGGRMVGQGF